MVDMHISSERIISNASNLVSIFLVLDTLSVVVQLWLQCYIRTYRVHFVMFNVVQGILCVRLNVVSNFEKKIAHFLYFLPLQIIVAPSLLLSTVFTCPSKLYMVTMLPKRWLQHPYLDNVMFFRLCVLCVFSFGKLQSRIV